MAKTKIFISHKRTKGVASTESILVHEILKKKPYYKVFMDVREDYLGEFPDVLTSEITNSDIFILLLPSKDVLMDKKGWVYREVKTALESRKYTSKPTKILPIAFGSEIELPSEEELGEIQGLLDYNVFYFDKNDPNIKLRLYKAIGTPKSYFFNRAILLTLICALLIWGISLIGKSTNVVQYPAIDAYTTQLSELNSLNSYVDNYGKPTNDLLAWYLEELDKKDIKTNVEFNKAYVKEGVIRLTVLSYLAFTSGDLAVNQDSEFVKNLIQKCYDSIPENYRSPISFNMDNKEMRDNSIRQIVKCTTNTLDNLPELKSVPEEFRPLLEATIISKVWPS